MPDNKCLYYKKSFKAVEKHLKTINEVAIILDITPTSIFGAMIEEHHDYTDKRALNILLDVNVTTQTRYKHQKVLEFYNQIQEFDLLYTIKDKIKNPVLNDISSYNIKIATAINLVKEYFKTSNDYLHLKNYQYDYGKLVKDMMQEKSIIPKIAGLMLVEAKNYFEDKVDKNWWQNQTQHYKDALYITYYNMGKRLINEKYQKTLEQNLPYQPQLGQGKAGGENHLFNIHEIEKYFSL